jgi:hypothetical protein
MCADCNCDLVKQLPPDGEEKEIPEYVEISLPYNDAKIAIIKSILDAEDVDYYCTSAHSYFEPTRLIVKAEQAERLNEILRELK